MISADLILYHGSYIDITIPDIGKCREGKDFGKGFYLTTDKNQAKRFVRQAIMKAKSAGIVPHTRNYGFVSSFRYLEHKKLKMFFFSEADREWLHCILAHRRRRSIPGERKKWNGYDVIGGKVANDFTNAVITTYLGGGYGEIGSDNADQTAIRLLEPDKLKDQYCFRTQESLKNLIFVKAERIQQ